MAGLTDEEMAALEAKEAKKPKALTDREMAELEAQQAPKEEPGWFSPKSISGTIARSFGQGGSLMFSDELSGVMGATDEAMARLAGNLGIESRGIDQTRADKNIWEALKGRYREDRDAAQRQNLQSKEENPKLYGGTELLGAVAMPLPGGAAAKGVGLVTKLLRGGKQAAAVGGAMGAGQSEATDWGELAQDVATSGALAAPFGVVGTLAGHALGKLGERFGRKAADVETNLRADKVAEEVQSAAGSYGQAKQDANRTIEFLEWLLNNPATSAQKKAEIQAFKATQGYADLLESAAAGTLESAPLKLGKMASTKQALADAPALANMGVDKYLSESTMKRDVLPRVMRYGKPAAAAVLGGMTGGPGGAAAGGLLGAASGAPGRSIANLVAEPRFQIRLNELLESGSTQLGEALGKRAASIALQPSLEGKRKALEKAITEDPEVAKNVEEVLSAEAPNKSTNKLYERFR